MPDSDVERLLNFYPRIYFACHARHVADPETKRKLTSHQASILDHLDDDEPMSLNGLARHMGVTAATMCIAVEKLVQGGYVRRERSESDRRQVLLRLTPAGKRICESHSVLEPKRVGGMLEQLSPEDRE
ncbi:MAG TPA: MarR family winged helix-turn-helix transcriptional regulator, partial [Fimbriimonadaceae bacterium]|nr:MarR family winged helix-turn-helix transcriptional regulator [Fimbriimonadaceae bacterium]